MVAMLTSDTTWAILAALERGQVFILSALLWVVVCGTARICRNVTIRLSVKLVTRLTILRIYVKRLLKTLVRLVMV